MTDIQRPDMPHMDSLFSVLADLASLRDGFDSRDVVTLARRAHALLHPAPVTNDRPTREAFGVVYTRRQNAARKDGYVWEGGPCGGAFYETAGKFGSNSLWFDTFEEAARDGIISQDVAFERFARQAVEYMQQQARGGIANVYKDL